MKTLNNNTKQAERYINAYNRSSMYDLQDAYRTPSTDKTRADYNCRMMMQSEGGHGYKIISYNTFQFSVAWISGNSLRIETACNSFVIPEAL